ncbi:YbbR-like protein [Kordia periserrulae]|uniref:YbbR-like protein n=1 Tax=Kordia periserrulae TaxID=701523 RepID=A0A2T6BUI8_9FLAO|nr:CdaR family protein [Kordia periserrulae]PTX59724.1 YbbR-like protein [Kordia periserrulae]
MPQGIQSFFAEMFKRKKFNVFLLFFIISFVVWTLVKLSNTYTDTITMTVAYTNLSEDKILLGSKKSTLEAQIKTTGFRMLRQKLFQKEIEVDLENVFKTNTDNTFYVLSDAAVNKHIYQDIEILKVSPDTLFFTLGKNKTKRVPVIHQLALEFEKGYNLYDSLQIEPKEIEISGPEDVVDGVKVVFTEIKQLEKISNNIDLELKLLKNDSLKRLSYSQETVSATAKVDKFTEGKLSVPLQVRNLPQGFSIKLFPKEVMVTYTANVSDFNTITQNDFTVYCDYNDIKNNKASFFIPKLAKYPETVKMYRIENKKINFLIKK